MNVLIVEDDLIIARDIFEIIRSTDPRLTLKVANTDVQAFETLKSFAVDIAFLDVNLSAKQTGLDIADYIALKYPEASIIFITAYTDPSTLQRAAAAKPVHYLVKPYSSKQVLTSFNIAMASKNKEDEPEQKAFPNDLAFDGLSKQEKRIVRLIARGKTSKEIAEECNVSEKTIRNHRYNITQKLSLPKGNNNLLTWATKHLS